MNNFPSNFFWGASTSAYQVEGNNKFSDWWDFELSGKLKYHSAEACRHYDLFIEDFNLARELNHNCHRLSVEWGRIEPEEGKFSLSEIEHYKQVIRALKERNLEPVITLHHFTIPTWLAKKGGWYNRKAVGYFLRFTEKIVEALAADVRFWVTINEPMVYVYHAYFLGVWPPMTKSILKTRKVTDNLLLAHIGAYNLIHSIYKRLKTQPMVSIAQNMQAFVPCTQSARNRIAVYLRNKSYNLDFIEKSIKFHALDYIGINYYSRQQVDLSGWGIGNFIKDTCNKNHDPRKKNSLGWDIYPEGLYRILAGLKKYNLPAFILENGICTDDDNLRWDFIKEHLLSVKRAMSEGANVIGYIYWSLIDNFEWDKGFAPRFGLISVDYDTYLRTIRPSARKFAEVCSTGRL